uniref:Elongation of very long chain fatty acids protein n=1 Tax=Lygus hesperus TaxID=30085 RepID=A0A146LSJ0_LYGHE
MTTVLYAAYDAYTQLLEGVIDPRTKDLPLMGGPIPVILLLICFNYFITTLGPALMKDRPPFELKKPMIVYNALQVVVNAWMVHMGMTRIWLTGQYGMGCFPVDRSESPDAMLTTKMVYVYFLTKLSDLTDTVFMVLRKKNVQISFLHQYHHIGMAMAGWVAAALIPGGSHVLFFGTINCFVHTVMYFYYLVTILKPEYRQSTIKRRITELQLAQFVITTIHAIAGMLTPDCEFPTWALTIFIPQDIFMFALFWDFYVKTYLKPKAKTPEGAEPKKSS